jgi:hypothetical protein
MNDIFVTSESPDGRFDCIVEADERSVWMYLHDKAEGNVISDAPVCSLSPLLTLKEFKEQYSGDGSPPLVEEYFAAGSVISDLQNGRIRIAWRENTPEVFIDQSIVSKIEKEERRGYSIFLKQECPWGHPLTRGGEPDERGQ